MDDSVLWFLASKRGLGPRGARIDDARAIFLVRQDNSEQTANAYGTCHLFVSSHIRQRFDGLEIHSKLEANFVYSVDWP